MFCLKNVLLPFSLYCKFKVENENVMNGYSIVIMSVNNTKFKSVNGLQFHPSNCGWELVLYIKNL